MYYGNATQVPKILNEMQRNKRVEYCKTMLSILENAERRDFRNIITLDETPLYFDNTSKLGWFSNGKNRPEVERASLKKKKVTLTVAWGVDGAVLVKCCSGENRLTQIIFVKQQYPELRNEREKRAKSREFQLILSIWIMHLVISLYVLKNIWPGTLLKGCHTLRILLIYRHAISISSDT